MFLLRKNYQKKHKQGGKVVVFQRCKKCKILKMFGVDCVVKMDIKEIKSELRKIKWSSILRIKELKSEYVGVLKLEGGKELRIPLKEAFKEFNQGGLSTIMEGDVK